MRENDRIDRDRRHGERTPVSQAQCFKALEEAAVDQQAMSAGFKQVARAGDRVCGPEEGEFHSNACRRASYRLESLPIR